MAIILAVIVIFIINWIVEDFWWIVAGTIAAIVLVQKGEKDELRRVDSAVKVELIKEVTVYKEKPVNTGFSTGYSWRSRREYYRYKKVLDHYEYYFKVVYADGRTRTIRCKKDSAMYRKLIKKCK